MTTTKDIAAVIMGGGQGARLFPLTRDRAKPAVPVAGRLRLIDIPLSNCINSGLTRIHVLTQFNSASLNRHVNRTYNFGLLSTGVEVIAAELTQENRSWFQGTADAVRRSLRHILDRPTRLVLILAGDHLYQMDYEPFLRRHTESGADITLSVCPVSEAHASSFGLVHCDEDGFITRFAEKPRGADLEVMRIDPSGPLASAHSPGAPFLASMGIYVFDAEVLKKLLSEHPEHHDFGKELIPEALRDHRLAVHFFKGYWEDIGTMAAFYRANMALAIERQFSLYDPRAPLYSRPRHLSPTLLINAEVRDSLIAEGSLIGRATIKNSIVGIRSRIGDGVELDGALVMGNDHYETDADRVACRERGLPPLGVGAASMIHRAILDKGVRIGRNVRIRNHEGQPDGDFGDHYVRDGIVIVPRNAVIADEVVI